MKIGIRRRALDRASYAAHAAGAIVRHPAEGLERVRERLSSRRARNQPPPAYASESDWHRALHDRLGLPWPCDVGTEFGALWSTVSESMAARRRPLGKGTFGGWDDGDPAFTQAVFCLARHLAPRRAVETGVARGVTTRFLLEALERNGTGELWSIDLPPLIDVHLEDEVAMAVPAECRGRWTYVQGSSRRRLPGVLRGLRSVDLFVHDSMHTERNVGFELDHVWPLLTRSGAMVVDDVDYNRALQTFLAANPAAQSLVAAHRQGRRQFAIILHQS